MSEQKIQVISAGAPNGWGEYWWETPDSVVAMPEADALRLLRTPHSGFTQAEEYDARPAKRGPGRPKRVKTEPQIKAVDITPESVTAPSGMASALALVTPKG